MFCFKCFVTDILKAFAFANAMCSGNSPVRKEVRSMQDTILKIDTSCLLVLLGYWKVR